MPAEAPWRIAGEVFHTYIICEDGSENLWLIDKHAAHERINFDRLMAAKEPPMRQTLMQPVAVEPGKEDAALLLENLELLERSASAVRISATAPFWCGRFPQIWTRRTPLLRWRNLPRSSAQAAVWTRSGRRCFTPWPARLRSRAAGPATRRAEGAGGEGAERRSPILPTWPAGGGEDPEIRAGKTVQAGVTACSNDQKT